MAPCPNMRVQQVVLKHLCSPARLSVRKKNLDQDFTNKHYIQEISVQSYFLNIRICICQNSSVARRPSAGEEGGMVALSHLPPFLGVEQKYFYGELVDQ